LQNEPPAPGVTPGWLASRLSGSPAQFQDDGRRPWHSLNFIVAHDGFTLRDLYGCNQKQNDQPWPYGPSNGGEDNNHSWDQGGDPIQQRQAMRTGLMLLMMSSGVPMITGGDERGRTQYCNNNPYNLDSEKNWLEWGDAGEFAPFNEYVKRLIQFRRAHEALRPANFRGAGDPDGDGLPEVAWFRPDGTAAQGGWMDDPDHRTLAMRIDADLANGPLRSILLAWNGTDATVQFVHPPAAPGKAWYRVADTAAWMEAANNFVEPGAEQPVPQQMYGVSARSAALFVER
jgi:isoamylase